MAEVTDADEVVAVVCGRCGAAFDMPAFIYRTQRNWQRRELAEAEREGRAPETLRSNGGAVCGPCEPAARQERIEAEEYRARWGETYLNEVRHGINNPDHVLWLEQNGFGVELQRLQERLAKHAADAALRAQVEANKEAARARKRRKGKPTTVN